LSGFCVIKTLNAPQQITLDTRAVSFSGRLCCFFYFFWSLPSLKFHCPSRILCGGPFDGAWVGLRTPSVKCIDGPFSTVSIFAVFSPRPSCLFRKSPCEHSFSPFGCNFLPSSFVRVCFLLYFQTRGTLGLHGSCPSPDALPESSSFKPAAFFYFQTFITKVCQNYALLGTWQQLF